MSISHDAEPKRYLTLIKQPHSTPPTPLLSQVCTRLLKHVHLLNKEAECNTELIVTPFS